MALKHYFIADVHADPEKRSDEVQSIQFDELSGTENVIATIRYYEHSDDEFIDYSVVIPVSELKHAAEWLTEKKD